MEIKHLVVANLGHTDHRAERFEQSITGITDNKIMSSAGTISLILTVLVSLAFVVGQDATVSGNSGADVRERAKSLEKELICPICPGESLHQSQSDLAKSMRSVIREKLELGQTDDQIKAYFVSVYGESVLAAPRTSGFSITAWIIPPVLLAAGTGVLIQIIRSYRRKHRAMLMMQRETNVETDNSLTTYLDMVDEELKN